MCQKGERSERGIENGENKIALKKEGAFKIAKHFTLEHLKAPSTAKFPEFYNKDVSIYYNDETKVAVVDLYVDAQNSFGAMIRSRFNVKLKNSKGNTWDLLNFSKI